ncbi:MAG TPA: FAD-dependent monooxygenase [Candidatus Dormibacteraeota bacterium]|jgi:2-polyprenyl-6-methoxyphenol hydroxylase-like FAD-dependent oxidoreductase|nr:FAD-dependent monooxygenase [Candidatus Dormibacteraeota bacterium]
MTIDVVVAGAGPTGLMLAAELSLSGARPVILERRREPSRLPKANGMVGQVVQLLDYRGLLSRLGRGSRLVGAMPSFPFGSVQLNFAALPDNPLRGMLLPQAELEGRLAELAVELGVEIRRGAEVSGLRQDGGAVTLEVATPDGTEEVRARYVVGCDGAHSRVRELAGIGFPGISNGNVHRFGHLRLSPSASAGGTWGQVEVPGFGRLQPGWNRTPAGAIVISSLQPGIHIVAVFENDPAPVDTDGPATLEELQGSVRRVLGVGLPVEEAIWVSRIAGQSRVADRFRTGRVFVAGDAAHVFPAGGSGLNVALLDAVNLAWKLGAEIRGEAPVELLDSYHRERHQVADRTQMQTRTQSLLSSSSEVAEAGRALFAELLAAPGPLRQIAELLNGSDVRYPMPVSGPRPHPLLGGFLPEMDLTRDGERLPMSGLLSEARPLLLDLAGGGPAQRVPEGWTGRVDRVAAGCDAAPARALMVRPDGHVAWAAAKDEDETEATRRLDQALGAWFSPAAQRR